MSERESPDRADDESSVDSPVEAPGGRLARLTSFLNEPVDAASVEVFRLAFGLIIAFECVRYLQLGVVHSHFIEPRVFFRYPGFGWLPAPLLGRGSAGGRGLSV